MQRFRNLQDCGWNIDSMNQRRGGSGPRQSGDRVWAWSRGARDTQRPSKDDHCKGNDSALLGDREQSCLSHPPYPQSRSARAYPNAAAMGWFIHKKKVTETPAAAARTPIPRPPRPSAALPMPMPRQIACASPLIHRIRRPTASRHPLRARASPASRTTATSTTISTVRLSRMCDVQRWA